MSDKPLIVVVGETMLDMDYELHSPPTTSPDGFPVYPVDFYSIRKNPGGAAAVAWMAKALGADVRLVTQYDPAYVPAPAGVKDGIWWCGPVSEKKRFIHNGKVLMRIDTDVRITRVPLSLLEAISEECQGRPVYLILSDYGKGMFDRGVWAAAIRESVKPVESFGDPHRSRPSMRDASELLGRCTVLAQGTQDPYWHDGMSDRVLRKDGPGGMKLFDEVGGYDCSPRQFGMDPWTAVDTCGCGDMAIAALAVARSEGQGWHDALKFATAAAAEKALVWGAVPVPRERVEARLRQPYCP